MDPTSVSDPPPLSQASARRECGALPREQIGRFTSQSMAGSRSEGAPADRGTNWSIDASSLKWNSRSSGTPTILLPASAGRLVTGTGRRVEREAQRLAVAAPHKQQRVEREDPRSASVDFPAH